MLTLGQSGTLGDEPVLVALGIGQRLVRRREDGTRVGHRLVQEELCRSRCPGRSARRCCVGSGAACCAAAGGRWSAAAAGERATNRPTAPVRRGSGLPPGGGRPGPGSTTGRPCRPRRPRSHPRPTSARAPRCRGCWISPRSADDRSPKTSRDPSGRTTVRQPMRIRAAAARPTRQAALARIVSMIAGVCPAAVRVVIVLPLRA